MKNREISLPIDSSDKLLVRFYLSFDDGGGGETFSQPQLGIFKGVQGYGLGEIKPLDTPLNYEIQLYFTMLKTQIKIGEQNQPPPPLRTKMNLPPTHSLGEIRVEVSRFTQFQHLTAVRRPQLFRLSTHFFNCPMHIFTQCFYMANSNNKR